MCLPPLHYGLLNPLDRADQFDELAQRPIIVASVTGQPSLEQFSRDALAWLEANATYRTGSAEDKELVWGEGDFSVAVFHALSFDEERNLVQALADWTQRKAERGYHAITWPAEYSGLGLDRTYARAFSQLEAKFDTPTGHEIHGVTTRLVAPTIHAFGTPEQKQRHVADFLAARELVSQLFSEPGAGSDLASLACRAERDGDEWVLNGQKVWSSGAQFAQWGELIARTDPDVPKHAGMTAFIVPLDAPGVEIRPIKQMSGGSSFNEVFFSDVRIPDTMRLGAVGEGWKVALTTLGFERDHSDSGSGRTVGGSWRQVLATARFMGLTADPVMRQRLMQLFTHLRVEGFVNRRAAEMRRAGATPGPEGSLGKLMWTEGMTLMADVVAEILGPNLIADTGDWGTYAWGEHVLGAPGYRVAGGSDETQRNIIGERVLGLPGEPRVDKGVAWKDVPR